MNGIRLLVVTDSFAPQFDAQSRQARQLVDDLVALDHSVRVLTASEGAPDYRGIEVVRLRDRIGLGSRIRSVLRGDVSAEGSGAGLDVIVVLSPDEFGRAVLKQAVRVGIPAVVIEQRPLPTYLPSYYAEQVLARASRLLVTTEWVASGLTAHGIAAQVWRPGVDTRSYHPGLRDEALHRKWTQERSVAVGYVGEFRKAEGVKRLAALASVPFVRPVLIGSGRRKAWLQANLVNPVFTRPTNTGTLGTAIASLDLLVHPGRQQSDSLAIGSALGCGVPVIAPGAGGTAEAVEPRRTGLHFDRSDPLGLVGAVTELVTDPNLRQQLAANAFAWAQRHDSTRAAQALVEQHLLPVCVESSRTPAA